MMQEAERQNLARKRKSKVSNAPAQTPDLNIPLQGSSAIVPVGLVNSRVNQIDGSAEHGSDNMIETLKKQKRGDFSQNATSAAAAKGSPRRVQ